MRKRPWEIVVLSVLYLLAPFGNLLQASWVNHIELFGPQGLIARLLWNDWLVLLCYPIIAVAIYSVRKVGWWIFVGFNTLLIADNFYGWTQNRNYDLFFVILLNIIVLVATALVSSRHVRAPYFSPNLRWWETEVRFTVTLSLNIPVMVLVGETVMVGHILDISKHGCFIDLKEDVPIGSEMRLYIACLGEQVSCQGRIVRKSGPNESIPGYGIMFLFSNAKLEQSIARLVGALKNRGARERNAISKAFQAQIENKPIEGEATKIP